jgi:hypothetical protein
MGLEPEGSASEVHGAHLGRPCGSGKDLSHLALLPLLALGLEENQIWRPGHRRTT